jgi:ADP-ribosylglycohydrolase
MPSRSRPIPDLRQHIRSSALWAAYGDALGFITELATSSQVRSRAGSYPVRTTVEWKRRVGGRGGPTMVLPAGCLSDDTQLRLAVSRSIGVRGFDPEHFAKIEMTVWPTYALGAGRGSKAAAANLVRRDASWATNFFAGPQATYVDGGGNGAAMRAQPHVWSARPKVPLKRLLSEVVSDAVITHGHVRGILGAALHALALRRALHGGSIGGPQEWRGDVADLVVVADVVEAHDELGGLWLGMWQQRTQQNFADAVRVVIDEIAADIDALEASRGRGLEGAYGSAIEALGMFKPDQRGSGTKTALLGSFLAWRSEGQPEVAMQVAANSLGTDTDSIATMAGALLGAVGLEPPHGQIADKRYIEHEADRMWRTSQGQATTPFPYPDLRRWQAPRSQSDALGQGDGQLHLAGLGPAEPAGEVHAVSGKNAPGWQWIDLWFGQRVLAKRRSHPPTLERSQLTMPSDAYNSFSLLDEPRRPTGPLKPVLPEAPTAPDSADVRPTDSHERGPVDVRPVVDSPIVVRRARSIHELTNEAIRSQFDPSIIGRHMIDLSESEQGVELSVAYAAILAKALMSRRDAQRRSGH